MQSFVRPAPLVSVRSWDRAATAVARGSSKPAQAKKFTTIVKDANVNQKDDLHYLRATNYPGYIKALATREQAGKAACERIAREAEMKNGLLTPPDLSPVSSNVSLCPTPNAAWDVQSLKAQIVYMEMPEEEEAFDVIDTRVKYANIGVIHSPRPHVAKWDTSKMGVKALEKQAAEAVSAQEEDYKKFLEATKVAAVPQGANLQRRKAVLRRPSNLRNSIVNLDGQ